MSKKFILSLFLSVGILSFLHPAYAAPVDQELMKQGSVKTCLKAAFLPVTETKYKPAVQTRKIHLTGRCESPSGCTCISSWGRNSMVERLEDEPCEQQFGKALDALSAKDIAKAKARGDCNPNKKSSRKNGSQNCGDCSCFAENKASSCGHAKADARNPILANLKPGSRTCHIVQNNKTQAMAQNGSQVLGAADGVLPYGDVDVVVEEETYRHTPADFLAAGTLEGTATGGGGEGEAADAGNDKTQKNGLLTFLSSPIDVKIDNLQTKCGSISWDPYGRTFDAVTLEPISDVEVTLIDSLTNEPAIQQYERVEDLTGEDGVYNILVENEGLFKLSAEPLSDHSFVSTPKLDPNWKHIYSDLYYPNVVYAEKQGIPTHHDIALQPNDVPYTFASAEPVIGSMKSQNMGDVIVYMGRVTFPFAKVCLTDASTGTVIGDCVSANNIGKFTIALDIKLIPPSRTTIQVEKVDLTKIHFDENNEVVETLNERSYISTATENNPKNFFEPILSYVDGYVYNPQGKVIPNALITLKLKMNDDDFYSTHADKTGYFTIPSNQLPYLEYYFVYTDPVSKQSYSKKASQFISDNKDYLESQALNLVQGTRASEKITASSSQRGSRMIASKPTAPASDQEQVKASPSTTVGNTIKLIVGALFILMCIGIAAFMAIKKSNTPSNTY